MPAWATAEISIGGASPKKDPHRDKKAPHKEKRVPIRKKVA